MDLFGDLLLGFSVALSPINLVYLLIGATIGMIVGIIPGFGPSAGIAILLPVTFGMDPTGAVVMLAAIYYASMYGGTITSILLNTPGESATVASTFDGYPLAQQGRAGPALVMQAVASFVGGTLGVILITLLAPVFSQVARSFGPPEYFLLAMMGIAMIVVMVAGNWRYGLISALIGFALGTVGVDLETGNQRFTFGSAELIGGIGFIPIAIGLFGLGELLFAFHEGRHRTGTGGIVQYRGERSFWPALSDWVESRLAFLRGSVLGFVIGVIPGAGATIASLMAYSVEKFSSRTPEKFGRGAMAGLVGPEAANNAASSGAMVPLLTLGIPGSASTAVLMAAFIMWGLRPGPLLMSENPQFAWGLIASMYLGNVVLLAINIFAIPLFVWMVRLPYRILAPSVILVCTIGTYSVNGSMMEVWFMFAAGIVGFFMKLFGFSPAALVLALVLGPLAEEALRQSLTISRGSFAIFVERPASLWILAVTAAMLLAVPLMRRFQGRG
ncbi:MAG TPA: tripartite tricarboxylate transporter permease [Beijerinckiaceae bacterium]|nr:tripartite tricarboxylate transporter permease [Beijerinckiaceae bacterium]